MKKTCLNVSPQLLQCCAWAGIFLVNAARLTRFFEAPSFYAEDGLLLFIQSHELGVQSLWTPCSHHFFISRAIAFAATFFPAFYSPLIYQIATGCVSSWCFSIFAGARFRWLIRSDIARFLLCFAFSLIPGTDEVFFAPCLLYYPLGCAVFLLLLERQPDGEWYMPIRRAILLSFLWFSVGNAIIFLPVLVFLFGVTRNKNFLICISFLLISFGLNARDSLRQEQLQVTLYGAQPFASHYRNLAGLLPSLQIYIDNFFIRFVYVPLLGRSASSALSNAPAIVFETLNALIAIMVLVVLKVTSWWRLRSVQVVGLEVCCVFLTCLLTVWFRDYGAYIFERQTINLGLRYAVLPALAAAFSYSIFIWSRIEAGRYAGALKVFLVLVLINIIGGPLWPTLEVDPRFEAEWPAQAAAIDRAESLQRAGNLSEPVVIRNIQCRPIGWTGSNNSLTIR